MRAAYVRMNYRRNVLILFNGVVSRFGQKWRCKLSKFRWGDYVLLVWNETYFKQRRFDSIPFDDIKA